MKRKLEIDVILVLLTVLGVAGAWIGVQVAQDRLGLWSEGAELRFTTSDLQGLGPRSELHCAGAVIGHVRSVDPGLDKKDGTPQFKLIAGVKREYVDWKFKKEGLIKVGVVQSALSPSSIVLEISSPSDEPVRARLHDRGAKPDHIGNIALKREISNNDLSEVLKQFTERQNGQELSVIGQIQDFTKDLSHASASLKQLNDVTASLSGKSHSTETPIDRLVKNLEDATTSLKETVGTNGRLDKTLDELRINMDKLGAVTKQTSEAITEVRFSLDKSMHKVDGLLAETTSTMTSLHGKVAGFGDTFVGRMLIKKEKPATTTTKTSASQPAKGTPRQR